MTFYILENESVFNKFTGSKLFQRFPYFLFDLMKLVLTAFPTNISERTTLHNFVRGMQLELGMRIGMRIRDLVWQFGFWMGLDIWLRNFHCGLVIADF